MFTLGVPGQHLWRTAGIITNITIVSDAQMFGVNMSSQSRFGLARELAVLTIMDFRFGQGCQNLLSMLQPFVIIQTGFVDGGECTLVTVEQFQFLSMNTF